MKYAQMSGSEREQLLGQLAEMPQYLEQTFAGMSAEAARKRAVDNSFAPIEQVWHLADLEREGFGQRITRLQREPQPQLPDFDGDAVARARDYRSLSLNKGLAAFAEARRHNIETLRALRAADWMRGGTQEGVGAVTLCDMPEFMLQHDAAHRSEIEEWKRHAD